MSTQEYNRKRTFPIVFVSYILICLVWGAYRLFLDKSMATYFQSNVLAGALLEGAIKTLILAIPSLILLHTVREDLYIPSRKFWAFGWRTLGLGLGLSAAFFIFYSLRNILTGGVRYTLDISVEEIIGAVFFAAITEEIMYRGFILNALVKKMGREWANVLAAVLFALMHLPLWIADGTTDILGLSNGLLSTACIGYLLGFVFLRSKSIWGAVIAHALHNLIVNVIQPG